MDRVHRVREIAAERARQRPTSWPTIAKRMGLSESQCRVLYGDFLRWDETRKDPMAVVDETIDCLTASMIEASDTCAHAEPGSAARVYAVRTFVDSATTRLALMQAAGKVPRYLGTFQAEQELRTVLREFADMLRKHEVGAEVLRDFLELAGRVQARRRASEQPALPQTVDGTATEKKKAA